MNIRIKFPQGQLVKRRKVTEREPVWAADSWVMRVSAAAYALAVWRLAADMSIASGLGLQGFFSHWQLWMALAVTAQFWGRNISRRTVQIARMAHARLDPARLYATRFLPFRFD